MNRRVLFAIIGLVVLGAVGFLVVSRLRGSGDATAAIQYKLDKVTSGRVRKTVSSSGTLKPWNIVDIKARAGGELTSLKVDVGDQVKKDQILAQIDPLDVQLSLSTARADEASAVARKQQSSETLSLQEKQTVISIQDAEAALVAAQANLRNAEANLAASRARLNTVRTQAQAQPGLTTAAIASAQASYEQAQKQATQTQVTNQQQRVAAQAAYEQALANQKNAQLAVDRQKKLADQGFVAQQSVDTAVANLAVIDAQVLSAKTKLDTVDAELQATLDAAVARVSQSRAALDQAKVNAVEITNRDNAVREAEVAVRQQQASVDQVRAQLTRSEVALRQAKANAANNKIRGYDVRAADATIARSRAARINAETTLERTEVRAPSNGVILQKYVEQGTIIASALSIAATGTNILQLGDTSRMYVDVSVDETDVASVDVGQVVSVKIEAYPDLNFDGKVIRVDPLAVVEQNVTTIHVRVEVDNSTPFFRLLKPEMNATCEFVISEKDNVLKVKNEAIHEDDQGKFVEVATGGKPAPPDPKTGAPAEEGALIEINKQRVAVETGVEGNDETEITSGPKEGDQIVVQTIEPAPQQAGGSPFAGGFGGGRPGGGGGGGGRGGR